MLNEQQAVEIYMAKLVLRAQSRDNAPGNNKMQGITGQSGHVSAMYGVTSRTIRDIWNRQSANHGPTQLGTCGIWSRSSELTICSALSMICSVCIQPRFSFILLIVFSLLG